MKLIVSDLDNTLLRSDKSVSDYTVDVFSRLRAQGYLIAFATARGIAAGRFVELLEPDALILNGGATVIVKGQTIYRNMLSADDVATIISMCYQFTDGKGLITVENDDGYFCNFIHSDPDRRKVATYSDFKNFNAPAYKISPELERDEWAVSIASACRCSLLNFTGEKWRRFAAADSNKASALKILVQYLGIKESDVIAFGDDINDLGMLQLAGTAVAVDNAIEAVKVTADHVTAGNDDDGVAFWLDRVLLHNRGAE